VKKNTEKKKLVLAKETVRQMQDHTVVQGGASAYTACYPYRCPNEPATKFC
jgi:hypothetical protein